MATAGDDMASSRKRSWLPFVMVAAVLAVLAVLAIVLVGSGVVKLPGQDPLVGTWETAVTNGVGDRIDLQFVVYEDGKYVLSGSTYEFFGIDGEVDGTWENLGEDGGCRLYRISDPEGLLPLKLKIPSSFDGRAFSGTWAIASEDDPSEAFVAVLKDDGTFAVNGESSGTWTLVGDDEMVCTSEELTVSVDHGPAPSVARKQAASDPADLSAVGFDENSCSDTCHTPMDPYVQTMDQQFGETGLDKWGNAVPTSGMLCTTHGAQGIDCQSCHRLTDKEMSSLSDDWLSGNYVDPLEERDLSQLVEAQGGSDEDAFCLNEACHDLTREQLFSATSDSVYNPHDSRHGEASCGDCHKAHRPSVNSCTRCHSEADVPEGWFDSEANELFAEG